MTWRIVAAAALAGLLVATLAMPALACTAVVLGVRTPASARGYTFLATVTDISALPDVGLGRGHDRTTFSVEHVYSGDVPGTVSIWTGICHEPRGFVLGERYLFSTSSIENPETDTTLAWRIADDRATLLTFEGTDVYSRLVKRPRTLEAALRLILGELPDTSTAVAEPLAAARELATLMWAVALGALLAAAYLTRGAARRRY